MQKETQKNKALAQWVSDSVRDATRLGWPPLSSEKYGLRAQELHSHLHT